MDAFLVASSRLGLGISAGLWLSQHVESDLSRFGNCPPIHRSVIPLHGAKLNFAGDGNGGVPSR
jgi:hypothetical protein